MIEEWKSLALFGGNYEISNMGRCRSVDRVDLRHHFRKGKLLKQSINRGGYLRLSLCVDGKRLYYTIHKLVALAFVPNPHNFPTVNHKDCNKLNNCASNLEWATFTGNYAHAKENHLLRPSPPRERAYCFRGLIEVYNEKGEHVDTFCGAQDMRDKGYIPSNVYRCLKGKAKMTRGMTFKRLPVP